MSTFLTPLSCLHFLNAAKSVSVNTLNYEAELVATVPDLDNQSTVLRYANTNIIFSVSVPALVSVPDSLPGETVRS